MSRYLILIHGDERQWDAMTPAEIDRLAEGHRKFVAAAGDALLVGGELARTPAAKALRGELVTDGPYVETHEVVGGFYVVEAPDETRALELAALLPELAVDHSGVEVRLLLRS